MGRADWLTRFVAAMLEPSTNHDLAIEPAALHFTRWARSEAQIARAALSPSKNKGFTQITDHDL